MAVTAVRTAKKEHRCDGCSRRTIQPGDSYLVHTSFPKDDYNPGGRIAQYKECRRCATRSGRDNLLPKVKATP